MAVALFVTFLCQMIFFSSYRVVDKQTMFLPADCIWAVWIAVGIQTILGWLTPGSGWGRKVIQLGGVALILFAILWNYPLVDQSQDNHTTEISMALLNALPADATVVGYWNTIPAIQYFQLVEGVRSDVVAINRFLIGTDTLIQYVRNKTLEAPVYFVYYPVELAGLFDVHTGNGIYYIAAGSSK